MVIQFSINYTLFGQLSCTLSILLFINLINNIGHNITNYYNMIHVVIKVKRHGKLYRKFIIRHKIFKLNSNFKNMQ